MGRAQYYQLLSRAMPNETRYELRWEVSLVEGWTRIHAGGIMHGESFIWPDPRLSRTGRAFLKLEEARKQAGAGAWVDGLGL